jgi:hypothetical protein
LFTPTGTTHKWCSDECKDAYKKAGNLSKAQVEIGAKAKLLNQRICGLVGCDVITPMSDGERRKRPKKYCCEEHSVKANKAYNAFRAGRITREELDGIVKEVYFRGEHKAEMELEKVTPDLPAVKLTANEAYARAMQVCEQIAAQEYEKILEQIEELIGVPAFDCEIEVEQSRMVCKVLEGMLADDNYTVIMEHTSGVGTYEIGWNMSVEVTSVIDPAAINASEQCGHTVDTDASSPL